MTVYRAAMIIPMTTTIQAITIMKMALAVTTTIQKTKNAF